MDCEERVKECESILKKIIQYEPDPFYVNYFFNSYIFSINKVYFEIYREACRDFGLFTSKKYTREVFLEKAKEKNDQKAIDFISWFDKKFDEEHKNVYSDFIRKCCKIQDENRKLPKTKIMIRAKERYEDDPIQEIQVSLKNEKLRSVQELQIEVKRQLPVFLEIVNYKRNKNNEPQINEKQIIISIFLDVEQNGEYIEIAEATKIYIPILKRLIIELRKKITELTKW